jgi:hypothetical protein
LPTGQHLHNLPKKHKLEQVKLKANVINIDKAAIPSSFQTKYVSLVYGTVDTGNLFGRFPSELSFRMVCFKTQYFSFKNNSGGPPAYKIK